MKYRMDEITESCLGKMLDAKKNKGEYQPYLANINVRWGSFDLEKLSLMRFEKDEEERYGIKYGDLIMCEGGEPGRCAIWRDELPNMKIQKALHRIRPNTELVDVEYLYYWQDNVESIDYTDKSAFNWISVIRLPDFITKKDFDWAVETASKKKKMDCSGAEFLSIEEGLCVQIMHIGAFDDEPATVAMMDKYLEENGYVNDFTDERRHHEIYLSDPRKVAPEKCKTVIRHPIKKA